MCLVDRLFIANYTVIVLVGVSVNNLCCILYCQQGSSALFPASEVWVQANTTCTRAVWLKEESHKASCTLYKLQYSAQIMTHWLITHFDKSRGLIWNIWNNPKSLATLSLKVFFLKKIKITFFFLQDVLGILLLVLSPCPFFLWGTETCTMRQHCPEKDDQKADANMD